MATFADGEGGLSVRTKINAVLQHADGTAGELVINDAGGDVDFRVESDTIANALFVDGATGNVGLGTNNPAGKKFVVSDAGAIGLEVSPNDSAQGYTRVLNYNRTSNQYAPLRFEALTHRFYTGTSGTVLGAEIDASGNLGLGISPRNVALDIYRNGSNPSEMRISNANDGALQLYTASGTSVVGTVGATPLVFRTFAQERMRIDAFGSVGIGVTPAPWNPAILLASQVASASISAPPNSLNDAYFSSNAYYSDSWRYITGSSASQYRSGGGTGSHQWLTAPSGTAGNAITFTQAMTLSAAGNLGIGKTSPATILDVQRNGAACIVQSASDTQALFRNAVGTVVADFTAVATYAEVRTVSDHPLVFTTNNVPRMRIDNIGNVGVGTSFPNAASIIDAQSTTKGVRFPNMTTTQKNAIANVAGNVIFDTDLGKLCVNTGSGWQTITSA